MAVFAKVETAILSAEAGESDNAADHGGETKYGISKQTFPNEDIAALTPERALTLLEIHYWNKYRCGEINDQGIANQIFFLFVNMNPIHAGRIIQLAINACGRSIIRTGVDGVIGSDSINALNSLTAPWLSDRLRLEAIRYYIKICSIDISQDIFFKGWVRRALS